MESAEKLYQRYASTIYHFFLGKTKNHHIAEELTQETFYQALRTIDRFKGNSHVSTWLFGIAKHVLAKHYQKRKRDEQYSPEISVVESSEDTYLRQHEIHNLLESISALGHPTEEVMLWRLINELSFRDIGIMLGKSENWARVTFYRGKMKLLKEDKNVQ